MRRMPAFAGGRKQVRPAGKDAHVRLGGRPQGLGKV